MKYETILAVRRNGIIATLLSRFKDGFLNDPLETFMMALDPANAYMVPRDMAEHDEEFLQIIPYVTFSHVDDEGTIRYAFYRRIETDPKHAEERLMGKGSIGIGGHVNYEDAVMEDAFQDHAQMNPSLLVRRAIQREIDEEIYTNHRTAPLGFPVPVGAIYDDRDAVGRVHLGLVFQIPVYGEPLEEMAYMDALAIRLRDDEKPEGLANENGLEWLTRSELAQKENVEGWTQILLPHLAT